MIKVVGVLLALLLCTPAYAYVVTSARMELGDTVVTDQVDGITSGAAVQLDDIGTTTEVMIYAKPSNKETVYIGDSTVTKTTGYPLVTSNSISLLVSNLQSIYVILNDTYCPGSNGISYIAVTE